MTLLPSLLQAIVQVDGEALVMHAGDKPYVVTPGGQVDLAIARAHARSGQRHRRPAAAA